MTRRQFVNRLLKLWGTSMTAAPGYGRLASAAVPGTDGDMPHYRPLNGRNLKDLALRKAHHGPRGMFVNPMGNRDHRNLLQVLYWKCLYDNPYTKYFDDEPIKTVSMDWQAVSTGKGVSVTFLKHAGVVVRDEAELIFVDPVFRDIFFFIKDFTPLTESSLYLPRAAHVLITHGHYDHLDTASLSRFPGDTHLISPLGYTDIFDDVKMSNVSPLDWFDTYDDGNVEITFIPGNHWTMRNPLIGPNRALWGGYIIRTKSGMTIFLSGDTAYFDGFEQIGSMYDIDLAIFNLGAYEPRWFMAANHMNPHEVVRAFQELKAGKLMVVHWGTFRLGDEPVHFPPLELEKVLKEKGLIDAWIDIRHGETVQFG